MAKILFLLTLTISSMLKSIRRNRHIHYGLVVQFIFYDPEIPFHFCFTSITHFLDMIFWWNFLGVILFSDIRFDKILLKARHEELKVSRKN